MLGALKRSVPWLITSTISLLLILWSRDQQVAPLQGPVSDLVAIGAYPVSASIKVTALWSENRRLRRQLLEKTLQESEALELVQQNERLRQLLDFRERSSFNLIPAEVIGYSSDEGVRGLLIDRGSESGIAPNQAVVTPDGLVGRVFRVHSGSAAVQLLNDPNLGVAAKLVSAQESGIIHATGPGKLKLDGVPVSATAVIGDSVVTSGQGGVFPPGILIGFTTKVYPSMEGWLLTVELKPSVDLRRVEEVFVVRSNPY